MPCDVESRGSVSLWYCCNCGDGPMNAAHSRACTSCNDHERCSSNGLCAYIPTPPESPLCADRTRAHRCKERPGETRIPKTALTDKTSQADPGLDIESDGHTDDSLERNERVIEPASDTLPNDELVSIQEAIDRLINTVVKSRCSLLSSAKVAPTNGVKSCPSGHQARSPPPQVSHQRRPQRRNGKENSQRHAKKASDRQRDKQESEDDTSSKPSNGTAKPDQVDQPNRLLACHFCKFNPHRYRHEKCGKKGWTASKLRGHLTRDHNRHKLFDCIKCFEVFPNETERDAHEDLVSCEWQSLTCPTRPAQGIRSRLLRSKDKNELIPALKSGSRATPQQQEEWWIKVYRLIHGNDARLPDSIYYDADENVRLSNDYTLQHEYRTQLAHTLQCQLPEDILRDAARFHLLSTLEAEVAEVQHLLSLSGPGDFSILALEALESWDVQTSRRASGDPAPGDGSAVQACDEPGESATNAIIISPSDADQLASSSTDDQLPDATDALDENGGAEALFALEPLNGSTGDLDMDQYHNDSDPSVDYNFNIPEEQPSQSRSSPAVWPSTSLDPGLFNLTSTLNWSTALPLPQRTPSFNTPPGLSSSAALPFSQDTLSYNTTSIASSSVEMSLPQNTLLSNTTSTPSSSTALPFPQDTVTSEPLEAAGPPKKKRRLPGGEDAQRLISAMPRLYALEPVHSPSSHPDPDSMLAHNDFLSLHYIPNAMQEHPMFCFDEGAGYDQENGLFMGGATATQDTADASTVDEMWAEFDKDTQLETSG